MLRISSRGINLPVYNKLRTQIRLFAAGCPHPLLLLLLITYARIPKGNLG